MTAADKLGAQRAAERLLARLRRLPITDAERIADELRAELDALFPPSRPSSWRGCGPARGEP